MARIVIDASVLLKAYFRDERGHDSAQDLMKIYARGDYDFMAPSLITYELVNACSVAHRKGRMRLDLAREILNEMFSLEIIKKDVDPLRERILEISCQYRQSAYDASYVVLARSLGVLLVTEDTQILRACPDVARSMRQFLSPPQPPPALRPRLRLLQLHRRRKHPRQRPHDREPAQGARHGRDARAAGAATTPIAAS